MQTHNFNLGESIFNKVSPKVKTDNIFNPTNFTTWKQRSLKYFKKTEIHIDGKLTPENWIKKKLRNETPMESLGRETLKEGLGSKN